MKKVLIFYASYGGGHLSAAKSIKQYIDENYTDVETKMVDCVKYADKLFEKLTTEAYKEMAKKAPWVWKKVYYNSQEGFLSKISNQANRLLTMRIYRLFREYEPDIVISTHPFSSQMTTILKKKGRVHCKLVTVMTDFAPHDQWLINTDFVDTLFVSNDNMKDLIVKNNHVNPDKIYVTGIPISKRFSEDYDRNKILSDFDFSPDKKTILFFGGGEYGLGKSKTVHILDILAKSNYNIQIFAIAGKNEKLKDAFEKVASDYHKEDSIKVLGFTDKVPELMAVSDLVITKPGGLTTSESLASGLPIVVINPIPGQEEENAEFLEKFGCAVWIKKDSNPEEIFNILLTNDDKLEEMKQNSIKLSKKNSTQNICDICLK